MSAVMLPGRLVDPAPWCREYVGLAFADHGRGPAAFDCWGLVQAVLGRHFGLTLPDYGDAYTGALERAGVAKAVRDGLAAGWAPVRLADAPTGALVILRLGARPFHCGVLVGGDWMLHAVDGAGVVLERVSREPWRNRIEGVYRYVG